MAAWHKPCVHFFSTHVMHKILIVNNDDDLMSLLKSWLEKRKYDVAYTSNADEILQITREFNPNVILVDILQFQAVDQLKSNDETSGIPVILMTGYTIGKDYRSIKSDDVIQKPFNLSLLE